MVHFDQKNQYHRERRQAGIKGLQLLLSSIHLRWPGQDLVAQQTNSFEVFNVVDL